ncbi:hypothetical protein Tco_0011667 [Tanacetum coccineum]
MAARVLKNPSLVSGTNDFPTESLTSVVKEKVIGFGESTQPNVSVMNIGVVSDGIFGVSSNTSSKLLFDVSFKPAGYGVVEEDGVGISKHAGNGMDDDQSNTGSNLAAKSSSINMSCVSNVVNVAELYDVPLKTLEDIDELTKGIEMGKYEAVWSGMTSEKHKLTGKLYSKPNSYVNAAKVASMVNTNPGATSIKPPIKLTKHVVILGVSIASKVELIGLVDKIKSGALDDVIYGLTTAKRETAHALVLKLAKGVDYVNSNSDTSSEEPNRVTLVVISHIDESLIVQSVSIQDMPSTYIGAAGVSVLEPSKPKANFLRYF